MMTSNLWTLWTYINISLSNFKYNPPHHISAPGFGLGSNDIWRLWFFMYIIRNCSSNYIFSYWRQLDKPSGSNCSALWSKCTWQGSSSSEEVEYHSTTAKGIWYISWWIQLKGLQFTNSIFQPNFCYQPRFCLNFTIPLWCKYVLCT